MKSYVTHGWRVNAERFNIELAYPYTHFTNTANLIKHIKNYNNKYEI